jgi:polysaccharide biosynthesis transport protein
METPQNYVTVSRRPLDVEDYIDILRRYRSWVIGPTFAGLVISVVIAFFWPDTYESRAVMRIMPQTVPASMVPSVIMGQLQQRLDAMQVEILGRPNLIQLIKNPSLDLYKKEQQRRPVEDIAEEMRLKDVGVSLYNAQGTATNAQSKASQAFVIHFKYYDRFKAQMVVRDLTTAFTQHNFQLQEDQAKTTATFIGDELKTAKARLDGKQEELSQFISQNQGRLPENYQANMLALNDLDRSMQSTEDQIGRDTMVKANLESELASARVQIETAKNNLERIESSPGGSTVRNQSLINLNGEISKLKQGLEEYLRKFKESMPEVATARAQIAMLEAERDRLQKEDEAAASGAAAGPTSRLVANPVAQQELQNLQILERRCLQAIANQQTEIDNLTRRREALRKQMADVQSRVATSPVVSQKYTNLAQEVALAKEQYEAESRRMDQSNTVQSLESHQAGERLETLEPATLPETPSYPNRYAITGLGTIVGLLAGFAMAGAKELKNTSLKNLKDVRAYTNLAILSSIPLLENALLVRRKRRLAWLAWCTAVVFGGILMCGAAYYHFYGGPGPS